MDPVTVTASNGATFTLSGAKRGTDNRGLLTADIQPISEVTVTDEDGTWISFSRWDDEEYWIADAMFKKDGYPVFSHGRGSRVTRVLHLDDEALVAAVNALFPGVWA